MKSLNDVHYKIKELTTGRVQVVHYDRMKRYHGPISVASNVQTRQTTNPTGYHTPPVPDLNHSHCGQTFIPYHFVPQMTSPSPGNRPTSPLPSPTPIADHFPNRYHSATPPPLLSSARQCSLPSPTRSIDHERRTPSIASVKPRYSSSPRTRQSSNPFLYETTFVQSPSRLDSLKDGASHNLRQRLYSSPQSNSPATLRTSLNKSLIFTLLLLLTFGPHPDLCVEPPNSHVKSNLYSKPSFHETSRNFCLLRRSHATTGNCKVTNTP